MLRKTVYAQKIPKYIYIYYIYIEKRHDTLKQKEARSFVAYYTTYINATC
jgi:hypothetical protein